MSAVEWAEDPELRDLLDAVADDPAVPEGLRARARGVIFRLTYGPEWQEEEVP